VLLQDSSTCDGVDCDGHVYSMWSNDHDEEQNPLAEENRFTPDFVAEYEQSRIHEKTGDTIFHGCATDAVDLAIGYGNIKTFRLLYSMHKSGLYQKNDAFDVDEFIEDYEALCIRNSENHLKDQYCTVVLSRAENDFEYYRDLLFKK